jgi:hypothetical protein
MKLNEMNFHPLTKEEGTSPIILTKDGPRVTKCHLYHTGGYQKNHVACTSLPLESSSCMVPSHPSHLYLFHHFLDLNLVQTACSLSFLRTLPVATLNFWQVVSILDGTLIK